MILQVLNYLFRKTGIICEYVKCCSGGHELDIKSGLGEVKLESGRVTESDL